MEDDDQEELEELEEECENWNEILDDEDITSQEIEKAFKKD